MEQININYDKISLSLFQLLTDFGTHIGKISQLHHILLKTNYVSQHHEFNNYINHYNKMKTFHQRCVGFLECQVINKSYSVASLCYFKKDLILVYTNSFFQVIGSFKKMKLDKALFKNDALKVVGNELDKATETINKILATLKQYNLNC